MNWYYEMNGAPVGPITDDQMELAKSRGGIQAGTPVWCEGWPDWKTAGEAWPEFFAHSASSLSLGTPVSDRCAECGQPHAALIPMGGVQVCPNCMPGAVAKLREGVSLGTTGGYEGPWREGDRLVTGKEGPMPECCAKCGQEPSVYVRKKLTWHHPGYYFTLLIGVLIYIVVAAFTRKSANLQVNLCGECNGKRRRKHAVGWISLLLGVAMIFGASSAGTGSTADLIGVSGFFLLLFSLIWAMSVSLIKPKRISQNFVWVSRIGPPVLESLPQFPGGE